MKLTVIFLDVSGKSGLCNERRGLAKYDDDEIAEEEREVEER